MRKLLRILVGLLVISTIGNGGAVLNKPAQGGASVALAAPGSLPAGSPLLQEAGIAAWTDLGSPLSLSAAQGAFKIVEEVGDDYVVGRRGERPENPHIYASSQGIVVVYYRRGEPTSRIISFYQFETRLQSAMDSFLRDIGKPERPVRYYHFAYPEATRILLVGDDNRFEFQIPSQVTLYEVSWALELLDEPPSLSLSGKELAANAVRLHYDHPYDYYYGVVDTADLAADQTYTVEIRPDEEVVFAFVYK
jgi:hypothetical protein